MRIASRSRRVAPRSPLPALAVLVLAGVVPASPAHAQQAGRFDVTGIVADSAGTGMAGAMVVALTRTDSVLTTFATTRGDGAFTLRRLPAGDYILQVTSAGYHVLRRDFSVTDADVDAGTVRLIVQAVELEALVVSVDHIPFINRGDTLVYNTLAFPTRPNANVEELLRRLPGIQVLADGSIKALGEDVKKVLVEGKEFFGSDPTIATRNLPADAVRRVQVYDRASDLAEFTGVADGMEERTIDIELQDGAKAGFFGRIAGGLGADGGGDFGSIASSGEEGIRYDQTFGLNRFTSTTQLAVLASANNVNQAGFSWSDYQNFVGGARSLAAADVRGGDGPAGGGRDDGFTETRAAGVNISHDFATRSWIRASWFLSDLDNLQDRTVQQQQLLGSSTASFANRTNRETTENLAHRLDLHAQYTLADGHDARLRANLTSRSSSLSSVAFQQTRTAAGQTLNTATSNYTVDGGDLGGSALLTWRRRLDDSGRTLIAELRASLDEPDLSGDLFSTTEYDARDPRGGAPNVNEVRQRQSRTGRTFGQSQRLSLTQPLGEGRLLEVFGERRAIDENQMKSVHDLRANVPVLNDALSSEFDRTYTWLRGGLNFTRRNERNLLVLGLGVQNADLDGTIVDRDEHVASGYTHVLPSARYRIQFRPGRSLDFRYSTGTREPTLTELQPFTDNDNPINVYTGNPDLAPEYSHSLLAEYRFFDQFSFTNLYTFLRATYTQDDIVLSRTVDAQGFQHAMPVNADRGWSTAAGFTWDTPVRPIGARLNIGYNVMYARGAEFVNQAENVSRLVRHTVDARIENRYKDRFDVSAGGRVTFDDVDYSLSDELNQNYTSGMLHASAAWYYRDAWTVSSSLNYRVFDADVFDAADNIAFLDASVSRLLFDERAELQLAGLDLLDQNQGVTFASTSSAITETRVESLGRRLMLRLTYRLGRVGGRPMRGR